jgi:hypothetical protein
MKIVHKNVKGEREQVVQCQGEREQVVQSVRIQNSLCFFRAPNIISGLIVHERVNLYFQTDNVLRLTFFHSLFYHQI